MNETISISLRSLPTMTLTLPEGWRVEANHMDRVILVPPMSSGPFVPNLVIEPVSFDETSEPQLGIPSTAVLLAQSQATTDDDVEQCSFFLIDSFREIAIAQHLIWFRQMRTEQSESAGNLRLRFVASARADQWHVIAAESESIRHAIHRCFADSETA
jgi:hypothetical protein